MAKPLTLEVTLTLAEAKAMTRLIAAGIAGIEADSTALSNEVTLRKAVEAARQGAAKISAAMEAAAAPARARTAAETGAAAVVPGPRPLAGTRVAPRIRREHRAFRRG